MDHPVPVVPQPPTKPWYTKGGIIILLAVLGFSAIGFLFFSAYLGYYLWVGKYGDATQQINLAKQFTEQFSLSPELRGVEARPTVEQPAASLIRPHNPTIGNPNAPITIVAFIDFECPFCQRAYPTFARIIDTYAPATNIVFKHFPVESIHPRAQQASMAAQCAHEQGKFWEYYNLLFTKKTLDDASLFLCIATPT